MPKLSPQQYSAYGFRWRQNFWAMVIAAFLFPMPAEALDASFEEAVPLIQKKRYAEAWSILSREPADPKDLPRVLFLRGKVLNRLGQGPYALASLTLGFQMGYKPADFDLEAGWALLQSGKDKKAAEYLGYYLKNHPDHPKALALMAEAELKLGQRREARKHLDEALSKDPSLRAGSAGLTAMILDEQEGKKALSPVELMSVAEADPSTRYAVYDRLVRIYGKADPNRKPWSVALTMGGGYNSNVIGLADGLLLPGNISHKGAGFARGMIDASSRWYFGAKDIVAVGGLLQADVYDGAEAVDLVDQFWYSTWQHQFSEDWISTLRISDEFTLVGGESYRNQVGVRPALVKYWMPGLATELAVPLTFSDYYYQTLPVQDRDGNSYGVALGTYWTIPGTTWQLRGAYLFNRNDAQGSDFEFDSQAGAVGLDGTLPWDIGLSLGYAVSFDDYSNPNSFTFFTRDRQDTVQSVSGKLSRPIFYPELQVYFQYTYTDNDSNILFYSFDQHVWSGGLKYQF